MIYTTPHVVHYFQPGHSFYAMDTWKANSKLTLTYGLRYELFSPLIDRNNQTSNFTPANGGGIVTAASNASGWSDRALIHSDLINFAPRLGFAYQMFPKLVWRGGYGVYYQHDNRIGSESLIQLNPPQFIDTDLSSGATNPVFELKKWIPCGDHDPTARISFYPELKYAPRTPTRERLTSNRPALAWNINSRAIPLSAPRMLATGAGARNAYVITTSPSHRLRWGMSNFAVSLREPDHGYNRGHLYGSGLLQPQLSTPTWKPPPMTAIAITMASRFR